MSTTFGATFDTEELESAEAALKVAVDIIGDTEAGSLGDALDNVRRAQAEVVDGETFEDRLTEASRHAEEAHDDLNVFAEHLAAQHREGRVRRSNEAVAEVTRRIDEARHLVSQWVDYAHHELSVIGES